MTYGDGFAALVGKTVKSKEYNVLGDTKTIAGSSIMFVLSLIITLSVFGYAGTAFFVIKAVFISAIATILEAISVKGTDNLTVPIVTSLLTYFFI